MAGEEFGQIICPYSHTVNVDNSGRQESERALAAKMRREREVEADASGATSGTKPPIQPSEKPSTNRIALRSAIILIALVALKGASAAGSANRLNSQAAFFGGLTGSLLGACGMSVLIGSVAACVPALLGKPYNWWNYFAYSGIGLALYALAKL